MEKDSKEKIIQETLHLIEASENNLEGLTMREICAAAGVGLGLINYHFKSKEALIAACVQRIIDKTIARFKVMSIETAHLEPFKRMNTLMNATFSYLFAHRAISRVSILTDMAEPNSADNTNMTMRAFMPLLCACRPDFSKEDAEIVS